MSDWPELEQAKQKKEEEAAQKKFVAKKAAELHEQEFINGKERARIVLLQYETIYLEWNKIVEKYLWQIAKATRPNKEWYLQSEYPQDKTMSFVSIEGIKAFEEELEKTPIQWEIRFDESEGNHVSFEYYQVRIYLRNKSPENLVVVGKKRSSAKLSEEELKRLLLTVYNEGPHQTIYNKLDREDRDDYYPRHDVGS